MKLKLDLILFGAALIIVGLLADAWRSARLDSQKLTASLAAQNSIIQQAVDREQQRDKQLNAALAAIAAQKRAVRTPQQAAEQLSSVLPPLPLPVRVSVPVLLPDPAVSANPSSTRSTRSSDSKWSIDSMSSIKSDLANSNSSVNSKSSTNTESALDSEPDSESRIETDSVNSDPAAADTNKWSIATIPPVRLDNASLPSDRFDHNHRPSGRSPPTLRRPARLPFQHSTIRVPPKRSLRRKITFRSTDTRTRRRNRSGARWNLPNATKASRKMVRHRRDSRHRDPGPHPSVKLPIRKK